MPPKQHRSKIVAAGREICNCERCLLLPPKSGLHLLATNNVYFSISSGFPTKFGHPRIVPHQFATLNDHQPTNATITSHLQARLVMSMSKALKNVLTDHDLPWLVPFWEVNEMCYKDRIE